mmetsp:Transcript_35755/g.47181  ORF Transcript_35755/g.47181 Transcript_35755/m.47181 type:complete len:939 (-) Transcript_35755:468-3284(-)
MIFLCHNSVLTTLLKNFTCKCTDFCFFYFHLVAIVEFETMLKARRLSFRLKVLQEAISSNLLPLEYHGLVTTALINESSNMERAIDALVDGNPSAVTAEVVKLQNPDVQPTNTCQNAISIENQCHQQGPSIIPSYDTAKSPSSKRESAELMALILSDEKSLEEVSITKRESIGKDVKDDNPALASSKRASSEVMKIILEEIDGYCNGCFEDEFEEPVTVELLQTILDQPFDPNIAAPSSIEVLDDNLSIPIRLSKTLLSTVPSSGGEEQTPRRLSAEIFEAHLSDSTPTSDSINPYYARTETMQMQPSPGKYFFPSQAVNADQNESRSISHTPLTSLHGSHTVSPRNRSLQKMFNSKSSSISSSVSHSLASSPSRRRARMFEATRDLVFESEPSSGFCTPFEQRSREPSHADSNFTETVTKSVKELHRISEMDDSSSSMKDTVDMDTSQKEDPSLKRARQGVITFADGFGVIQTPNIDTSILQDSALMEKLSKKPDRPMFEVPTIETNFNKFPPSDVLETPTIETDLNECPPSHPFLTENIITPEVQNETSGTANHPRQALLNEGTLSSQEALQELNTIKDILSGKVARVTPSTSPLNLENTSDKPRSCSSGANTPSTSRLSPSPVVSSTKDHKTNMVTSTALSPTTAAFNQQMMMFNPMMMMMMMQSFTSAQQKQKGGMPPATSPVLRPAGSTSKQVRSTSKQPKRTMAPIAPIAPVGGGGSSGKTVLAGGDPKNLPSIRPNVSQGLQVKQLEKLINEQITSGLVTASQASVLRWALHLRQPWMLAQMESVLAARSAGNPAPLQSFIGVARKFCGMMPMMMPMQPQTPRSSSCPSPSCPSPSVQPEKLDMLKSQLTSLQEQLKELRDQGRVLESIDLMKDIKKVARKIKSKEKAIYKRSSARSPIAVSPSVTPQALKNADNIPSLTSDTLRPQSPNA